MKLHEKASSESCILHEKADIGIVKALSRVTECLTASKKM